METTENNRLIAEFMGFEWMREEDFLNYNYPEGKDLKNVMIDVAAQKYQTSWDWLMPVVKKCLTKGDDTDYWDGIYNALSTIDIKEVYEIVVEFIKWYNKNLVG